MPFVWAFLAGVTAVGLEFSFRQGISWVHNLWWIAPAAILVNFGVYRLLTTDFGWLPSIILFGATTATLRICLTFLVLREPLTTPNIVGAGILVFGVIVKLIWR